MSQIAEIFSAQGPFAAQWPGYQPRAAQIEMAEAVAETLAASRTLLVEAGTGTGKTFAYLVPAMLSGRKTVISTGTRNLQDQLFHRDVPQVKRLLGRPLRAALLKGRSNYLCPYRLAQSLGTGQLSSREAVADLQKVAAWAGKTQLGDMAELIDIAEDSPVWPYVTSTADNCLGQACPNHDECPLMKARATAAEADLVVVNHHLFFADKALRERGFGELLPPADAVIFDEAHQLPDVAAAFFGQSLSSRQILDLLQDALREVLAAGGDLQGMNTLASTVEVRLADVRLLMGPGLGKEVWSELATLDGMPDALATLNTALQAVCAALGALAETSRGLEAVHRRCEDLCTRYEALTGPTPADQVHWIELFNKGFVLQWTPLDISGPFRQMMAGQGGAWVLTSATLAVAEDFRHISQQLGLSQQTPSRRLSSPFAYAQQAVFYVPRDLPDPASPAFGRAQLDALVPVLRASRGRAFLLFTSHKALREAAEQLPHLVDFPLLVQGTRPKAELLRRFQNTPESVLLATGAFWEGVDVRGAALSLVVIDKLPFASPGDPVVAARLAAMQAEGRNPFASYQLPEAIIALKQGAGRLIRDVTDTGVLMVCDPRLVCRPYGKLFLDSLPPMRRTRDLHEVVSFFRFLDTLEPPTP